MEELIIENQDEIMPPSMQMEAEILNEESSDMTGIKIETVVNLNECCISCLTEGNNEHIKLKSDKNLLCMYKELVNKKVEQKVKDIPIMFCEPCANLLETLKNFKNTCLESLSLLEELIAEKRAEERKLLEERISVKVEFDSESDQDVMDQSSDEEFIPDIKTEVTEAEEEYEPSSPLEIQRPRIKKRKKMKNEGEKNVHICSECGKKFPRPANLRNHFLKKHRGAKHCKYCQKAFENDDEFVQHMEMEEERVRIRKEKHQKIHVCEICGLTTKFRSNLVKHMDTHLPDTNSVKCEVCGKSFKSMMLLKNHVGYHKEKTFGCDQCEKKFLFAKDLERHIRLVHEQGAEYTECSICNKRVTVKGLNSHVKQVHMDIRPHVCRICGLAFKSSSNIKKHMYSHSGTRPFNCHICGQGTYMTCTLKEHYNKAHGIQYSTSEINKVCVKLPPGPLNTTSTSPPSSQPHNETTLADLSTVQHIITIPATIASISPVNLAK